MKSMIYDQNNLFGDFPGGPVAKTVLPRQGPGLIPGQGTRLHMPNKKDSASLN